jgi:hypothetical protein
VAVFIDNALHGQVVGELVMLGQRSTLFLGYEEQDEQTIDAEEH